MPEEVYEKALTLEQFDELTKEIAANHRFYFWDTPLDVKDRKIKYIYPSIDVRDGNIFIFHVSFRGLEGTKSFNYIEGDQPLYHRIKRWLNREEE